MLPDYFFLPLPAWAVAQALGSAQLSNTATATFTLTTESRHRRSDRYVVRCRDFPEEPIPTVTCFPDRHRIRGLWQCCSSAEAPGRRRQQAGHGSSPRKCPRPGARAGAAARTRMPLLGQAPPRRASAARRIVPPPRPAGAPVFSQRNLPSCRRAAGAGALRACSPSRRAGGRLTVALFHLPPPPGSAEARRSRAELPPRSLRRRSQRKGYTPSPPRR